MVRVVNILAPYRLPTLKILEREERVRFETWLMASREHNRPWAASLSHGLRVRVFADWGIDLSHREMLILHFNPGILRELSRRPPDLVVLGGYESPTNLAAGLLLDRRKVPFLFGTGAMDMGWRWPGGLLRALIKNAMIRSSGVMVPGSAAREHALGLGVPTERISIVPYSVDTEMFTPISPTHREALRRALNLPQGVLCLFVGNLVYRKGVDLLLEAFRRMVPAHPEAHLLFLGEGPLREDLTRQAEQDAALSGRVHLLGPHPYASLPSYYGASDVFVLPTRDDIWGMVLNEAMSVGLPVISSNRAGGAIDLIEDGVTGFNFPAEDVDTLSTILGKLVADEALREEVGREARRRIMDGFTPAHSARGAMKAILKTLESAHVERRT
ncbi:MAG: glycosyltransferase family 4 protein [Thermoplasmata archaeon]